MMWLAIDMGVSEKGEVFVDPGKGLRIMRSLVGWDGGNPPVKPAILRGSPGSQNIVQNRLRDEVKTVVKFTFQTALTSSKGGV